MSDIIATEAEVEDVADGDETYGDTPDGHDGETDGNAAATPTDASSETAGDEPTAAGDGTNISAVSVVEAILFASDGPLPAPRIARLVGTGGTRETKQHIKTLNERYASQGAAFRIEEVAGGYCLLTLPEFHPWLSKLRQTRAMTKLSKAALETLAIVAYKQPCLRAEIEVIRGVASGEVLNRLREMGLVKIVGRAEEIGRPMLYGTTRKFLDVFGLQQIEDLPAVEGLTPPS